MQCGPERNVAMRPANFSPEVIDKKGQFIRDRTTGLVWHRAFARPLYADTDRSQVVYHANYLRYFEIGRTSLMRDLGYTYRKVEEAGYVYPIVELGVNFYSPLYYDDPMWIHSRPAELKRVKVKFDYIVTHAETGNIVCKGFTLHCALNLSGRPVQVDQKSMDLFKTFPA